MKRLQKIPSTSRVSSTKVVAPEHLNAHGTLFGGYLMCWVDEVAYICARKFSGSKHCVTVQIDNISFKQAAKIGDHLILSATVINVGLSSMDIRVTVQIESHPDEKPLPSFEAFLTFVSLDSEGKKRVVPLLDVENPEEIILQKQALIRKRVRDRFNKYIATQAEKLGNGFSDVIWPT